MVSLKTVRLGGAEKEARIADLETEIVGGGYFRMNNDMVFADVFSDASLQYNLDSSLVYTNGKRTGAS